MYVGVSDDDILGFTLYILYGMYNEESSERINLVNSKQVCIKTKIYLRRYYK